nr:hypothetical protein [Lacipirellula limnantheis]
MAAERAIEAAIRLDSSPRFLSRWAEFSFQRRHYKECLKRTDESLALDPCDPDALLLRAKALAAIGRLPEAKEAAHQVLKSNPMSPAAHHQVGSLNLRGGSTSQALGPLLEARRLNPMSYNDRDAIAGTYGRLLWPFRVIDSHLLRFGSWPPMRRWLFLSTISTVLLIIAYLRLPPARLAMPAFLLAFNILALPLSNDLLSIAFGKFVFRKDLDLAWYRVIPELIRVVFPIMIHALISAVAIVAAGNPYVATFTLALIPNFELFVQLVRDRDELITVLLWMLMTVGVFTPIIVAMTFLEDGFQIQYAILCWSISLLSSFLISLHRR